MNCRLWHAFRCTIPHQGDHAMRIASCHRPSDRSRLAPRRMRGGNSVTLWDEIAPPATPPPVPVDTGDAAPGGVASCTG
jgi:hypothetical protein